MSEKRISAAFPPADVRAVLEAIQNIRLHLLPFLIELTPEEIQNLPGMNEGSRAFVSKAIEVAAQNPDILPRSFDVEEMRRDVEILEALTPIRLALSQLFEMCDYTYGEVESEVYSAGLLVYQYARAAGKGSALDTALDAIAQLIASRSRRETGGKPAKG